MRLAVEEYIKTSGYNFYISFYAKHSLIGCWNTQKIKFKKKILLTDSIYILG